MTKNNEIKKRTSIWKNTVDLPSFEKLENNIEVDIAVVGGGITGLLIAYYLKQSGRNVVVFEKNKIGMGITKNTTAFISSQHDRLYSEMIDKEGYDKAKLYFDANQMAIFEYKKLSQKFNFDFEELSSFVYTTKEDCVIEKEREALEKIGANPLIKTEIDLPFAIKKAVEIPNQAQMNPLKLIKGICQNLKIYEKTNVSKIKNDYLVANDRIVKFNKVIVATHFPFINKIGLYYAKMYQKRSYVIAIKTKDEINGIYNNLDEEGFYFRKYQDYLIIGSNDQRVGTSMEHFNKLREFASKYYSKSEITNEWANQDCVTLDEIPYIGYYSNFKKNIYVATGFNLWGMTQSMISAIVLTDLINGKDNKYYDLYDANRNIIKKQLFINLGNYLKNLLKFRKKTCTHLHAALVWNADEQAWECPCHGSRFNEIGEVIDNPATKNLKNKKEES